MLLLEGAEIFYEKLENTNEINNRIVSKYFRQPAILNFDLFMYLLRASDNKDFNANERLRYIFEQEDVLEFLTKPAPFALRNAMLWLEYLLS